MAFSSSPIRDVPVPVNATTDQLDNIPLSSANGFKEIALPWYADQVLPFDVTLAAANEYGAAASAKIYGIEILNEGFGTSVDDSVLEQQATFVARSVLPLQAVGHFSCAGFKTAEFTLITWPAARVGRLATFLDLCRAAD